MNIQKLEEKERLQQVQIIPFRTFREKIAITKKYDHKAKMEIVDNQFVLVEMKSHG